MTTESFDKLLVVFQPGLPVINESSEQNAIESGRGPGQGEESQAHVHDPGPRHGLQYMDEVGGVEGQRRESQGEPDEVVHGQAVSDHASPQHAEQDA